MNNLAALQWQYDMGVDEAVSCVAINRLIAPVVEEKVIVVPPALPSNAPPVTSTIATDDALRAAAESAEKCSNISELEVGINKFQGLSICKTATNTVFSDGDHNASVMIIADVPNNDDDVAGKPLSGDNGRVFDGLMQHVGLARDDNLYVISPIFWRPPGNRRPTDEELKICRPFLLRHIELAKPEIVIILGNVGYNMLYEDKSSLAKIRGEFSSKEVRGLSGSAKIFTTINPSTLIKNPMKRKVFWFDILKVFTED